MVDIGCYWLIVVDNGRLSPLSVVTGLFHDIYIYNQLVTGAIIKFLTVKGHNCKRVKVHDIYHLVI